MNGFAMVDSRSGTCVYSMVLQPGLGVAAVSSALDDSSAASTLAAMSFGMLLNAAAISGRPLCSSSSSSDSGYVTRCRDFAKSLSSSLHGRDDTSPNAATLRCMNAREVRLNFFAHSFYPIICVASSRAGCPLNEALCERLCKAFCANCGCDYVERTQSASSAGPVKQYKKVMAPVVKAVYGSSIREYFATLGGPSVSTALFVLLSGDRKKILRSVAVRSGADEGGATNDYSESEGDDVPEVLSSSRLSRREVDLLKPLAAAKPYGSSWITRNERGEMVVLSRSNDSSALVCLVMPQQSTSASSLTLLELRGTLSNITKQLAYTEDYLTFLRTNNVLVV